MILRVGTLNVEQDHKRWNERRELIAEQLCDLRPDIWALNEIHVPSRAGMWLQQAAARATGRQYTLLQQTKVGEESRTQAEGLLVRFPLVDAANIDYRSHNCVALVARLPLENAVVDVYVTHLIAARVDDSARRYQVRELLKWIATREGADHSIVCGDFNASPSQESIRLMLEVFRPTQTEPTAFTPLRELSGEPTHPEWERFDRCIDYIWISPTIKVKATGLCFNIPAPNDPTLWPSDHAGVWADLEFG